MDGDLPGTLNFADRTLDSCVNERSQLFHVIRSSTYFAGIIHGTITTEGHMGRSQSTWLGFLTFLPLLSAAQQPVPVSEQTSNHHMIQPAALGPGFTQTSATQPAVPQPRTPPTAAPAAFEVSTVKLNKSGSGSSGSNFNNGRFTATNIQLKNLMEYSAYGIPQPRILGGPKWLDSERFDIEAKLESAAAERLKTLSRDQRRAEMQAMFQQLLADRFKIAVHWEMRELPVYALVAAKNGPILQESKNAPGDAGTSSGDGQFSAKGMTLTEIAEALTQELSRELGRVVIDKTGIQGRYDIALKWTPETGTDAARSGTDSSTSKSDAGPSIFTALKEQVGLKLESARGPVKVLVIDHAEMPTEN